MNIQDQVTLFSSQTNLTSLQTFMCKKYDVNTEQMFAYHHIPSSNIVLIFYI